MAVVSAERGGAAVVRNLTRRRSASVWHSFKALCVLDPYDLVHIGIYVSPHILECLAECECVSTQVPTPHMQRAFTCVGVCVPLSLAA